MSKKRKGQSVVSAAPSPSRPARPQPVAEPSPAKSQPIVPSKPVSVPESERPFELIRFDKRLKWFLGIITTLFLLMVLARVHFISVAAWNQLLPDGANLKRGLISGEPRRIRMDDYAVGTPWFMSQVNRGLPQENEAIGGQKAPVLLVPSGHFSALFKPVNWGAFLFGTETAYAWGSDVSIYLALIGVTLMLLLLTRNQFWLAVFGSLWILLSAGTQSWVYIPVQSLAAGSFVFVAAVYLLYGRTNRQILLGAVALAWSLIYFVLILYPPYQVPLVYVILALFIGYILNQRDLSLLTARWPWKVGGGLLAFGALAVAVYAYYVDMKPTLDAVTNTVYPGKRDELGGTGFIANAFSEYFSWFFTDAKFPQKWLNHCELSHYLTFTPIIIPALAVSFVQSRRIDWPLLLLSLCILLLYVWMEFGLGHTLARLTLLNMSPTRRTQIPLGIGNVLLAVLYLNYIRKNTISARPVYTVVGGLAVLGLLVYAGSVNIADGEGFFKWHQLFVPILFFTALGILLLPTLQWAYKVPLFCAGILLFVLPNIRLNPVGKGLSPITENAFYTAVRQLVQQDPDARWLVNGNQFVTYMVTATGAKQITGVKYLPDRKHVLNILDPQMKRDSAYNRYAHVTNQSFINGRDSVILVNQYEDGYVIAMDPCSPRMKPLNVKYQVFDHQPQPVEVRCMKSVATLGSLTIYQMNP